MVPVFFCVRFLLFFLPSSDIVPLDTHPGEGEGCSTKKGHFLLWRTHNSPLFFGGERTFSAGKGRKVKRDKKSVML